MMKFFKSLGGYNEITQPEKNCWVNVVSPDNAEKSTLQEQFKIPEDILKDILDVDERPRLEFDDEWTLIILRIPIQSPNNGVPFYTVPLGVFMSEDHTITISGIDNEILPFARPSLYREHYQQVDDRINFILRLFLHSAAIYQKFLKHLNQQITRIEKDIEKSIRNQELHRLLKMEKCLVYFITSLKANELVLAKFKNSKKIRLNEINEDLMEDAIIENKQAADLAQIYSDVQSGMMDAFASVISNNLNVVMKQLTSITIILMIPTLIASFYGMNVINYLERSEFAFPLILIGSILMSGLGILVFRRKDFF